MRVNEASEWDWNNSTEVNIKVGESLVVAPTSAPTDSEIFDDEDEPRQPKMRSLRDLYDSTNEVHLVCLLADAENISFEEAVRDKKWQTAMDEEIKAIHRNNTWEVTELPKESQPIGVKWVFKKKMNAQGKTERYKARLVAKGYKQKVGIDNDEVFAPVTKWRQSDYSFPKQLNLNGRFFKWMSSQHSRMVFLKKKFISNNYPGT